MLLGVAYGLELFGPVERASSPLKAHPAPLELPDCTPVTIERGWRLCWRFGVGPGELFGELCGAVHSEHCGLD